MINVSKVVGRVIWITGLSGAGKSTLARRLVDDMRALGRVAILLDGDELRDVLGNATLSKDNHSLESRLALAMRYARLCRLLATQGFTVVIATISLFREVHEWNRSNLPGYFEVYLKVPLEELRRRDPKEIYHRFYKREISNVAGLDLPVDEPDAPDWIVDFDPLNTPDSVSQELIKHIFPEKNS
jgi:adenylylsulfate kinase